MQAKINVIGIHIVPGICHSYCVNHMIILNKFCITLRELPSILFEKTLKACSHLTKEEMLPITLSDTGTQLKWPLTWTSFILLTVAFGPCPLVIT